MNIIESAVHYALAPHRSSTIWLAVSGGLDSMVLLHATHSVFEGDLNIIHIDHQLNSNSDQWAQLVVRVGNKYRLNTIVQTVECNHSEASARNARYDAILQYAQADDVIVTAHHLNDQYETFIHRAFRGTSLTGLLGIAPVSNRQGRTLIRPLINIEQHQIEKYAAEHNIEYIDDPSNLDMRYKRNEIRLALSQIKQKKPFKVTLEHLTEQSKLLDHCIQQSYQQALIKPHILNIEIIKMHPERMQLEIVHRFVQEHLGAIPQRQIKDIYQSMCHSHPNRYPEHNINQYWIKRYRHEMYIIPEIDGFDTVVSDQPMIDLGDCGHIYNPNRLTVAVNMLREKKSIHKKHLQNLGIPDWLRIFIPLIQYQNNNFTIVSTHAKQLGLKWSPPHLWSIRGI